MINYLHIDLSIITLLFRIMYKKARAPMAAHPKKAYKKKAVDSSTDEELEEDQLAKCQDILKNKRSLGDYRNVDLISYAIRNKLAFTQNDFDNFILAATFGPRCAIKYWSDEDLDESQIIEYFFTNFTPDDKQFKLIASCYESKVQRSYQTLEYLWLDTLLNRGFMFSDVQKAIISTLKYPHMGRFLENDGKITKDTINYYINLISDSDYDELKLE